MTKSKGVVIDKLFEKEQDLSSHLKDIGVILLDLSDSVKGKLSEKDTNEVKDLITTFKMNCDAMTDDLIGANALLTKVKAKTVSVGETKANTADLKQHLAEVKEAVARLRRNADEFMTAKNRDLVFKEMNKDYSDILGSLTELMAESV